MPDATDPLEALPGLLQQLREGVTWKPGAAARHLLKRKLRGHLPPEVTLGDYDRLIRRLLESEDAAIYVYYSGDTPYLAAAVEHNDRLWLVMASFDGVMETAFVVDNPTSYLERPAFRYIGRLGEVMK